MEVSPRPKAETVWNLVARLLVVYGPCFTLWQGDSLRTHLRGKDAVLTVRISTSHLQSFLAEDLSRTLCTEYIRTTASHLSLSE